MPYAFARRREMGDSWGKQFRHALRRVLLLIAIGVFLDVYADQVVYVQFIRVLQQIALGYLLAFLVLDRGPAVQAATAGFLLLWHPAAFLLFGLAHNTDPWSPCYNFGTWVDWTVGLPLSRGSYVTVNAVSSAATILMGVLAGELLRTSWSKLTKLGLLIGAGLMLLLAGWAVEPVIPMVKRIWTSSFALLAGGWTLLMLAAFYGVVDVVGWRRWTFPLVVVGMNSIAAYVIAGVLGPNVKRALGAFLNVPLSSIPVAAPIILAALAVLVQWYFCYWLYRHKIFFKV
jgi:predicted acyltransferase